MTSTNRARRTSRSSRRNLIASSLTATWRPLPTTGIMYGNRIGRKFQPRQETNGCPFCPAELAGKKETLPAFILPQLASEAPAPPVGAHWVHELKLDGYHIPAHVDKSGKIKLFTRSGLEWTHRMPLIVRELGRLKVEGAILDGEVVVLDADGQSSFAKLQAAFDEGASHPLTYFVFDLLHLNGHNLRHLPLAERKQILELMLDTLPEHDVIRYGQHIETEGKPIFDQACKLGAEGIVSKRSDSAYTSGRTKSWIKIKCDRGGVRDRWLYQACQWNRWHRRTCARLLRGEEVDLCGADGYWFHPGERAHPAPAAGGHAAGQNALRGYAPAAAKGALWIRPELVAEVQFSTWTADKLVRQASFKGLREDKKATEVRREVPDPSLATKALKAAEPAASAQNRKGEPASDPVTKASSTKLGFRVTHPDKIVDPQTGVTKQALIDYYLAVAPRMVPHVAGRPLSLVRCPNGAGQKCFIKSSLGRECRVQSKGLRFRRPKATPPRHTLPCTVRKAWPGWRR